MSFQPHTYHEDVNYDLLWLERERERVLNIEPANPDMAERQRETIAILDKWIAREKGVE